MSPETSLDSTDGSNASVGLPAEGLSPQEAKQRIKEIMKDARLAPIQAEFSRIPLYCRWLIQYQSRQINAV